MQNHKINAPLRAAVYIRVSSEMQLDGYSLGEQESHCRQSAVARGWEVVKVYVDEAESAKTTDRPQFQQMMRGAAAGEFEAIIVFRFDRFARNRRDMENYLYALDQMGVAVYSATEKIDRSDASGKAYLGMISVFNQFYVDLLSENVKVAKAARVKRDKLWNSAVPFGYTVHYKKDGGDGIPRPDPHDAEGVRLAFEHYATGLCSFNDIANVLNEAGYRPKGRGARALRLFSKDSVGDLLKNRFYLGEVSYKGEWFEGAHEAILTPELFERCQRARKRRRPRYGTTANSKSRGYPLTGIARCARCGERLRGAYSSSSQRRYYRDPSQQKGGDCDQPHIQAEIVESALGEFFSELMLPEDWQVGVLARVQAQFGDVQDAARQQRRLQQRLDRLKRLYLLDEIDETEFLREREQLRDKLHALQSPEMPDLEQAAALLQNFGVLWSAADLQEQRQLAHTLLEAVYLDAATEPVVAVEPRTEFALLFALLQNRAISPVVLLQPGESWVNDDDPDD